MTEKHLVSSPSGSLEFVDKEVPSALHEMEPTPEKEKTAELPPEEHLRVSVYQYGHLITWMQIRSWEDVDTRTVDGYTVHVITNLQGKRRIFKGYGLAVCEAD